MFQFRFLELFALLKQTSIFIRVVVIRISKFIKRNGNFVKIICAIYAAQDVLLFPMIMQKTSPGFHYGKIAEHEEQQISPLMGETRRSIVIQHFLVQSL